MVAFQLLYVDVLMQGALANTANFTFDIVCASFLLLLKPRVC